jgi:hypothetical protein
LLDHDAAEAVADEDDRAVLFFLKTRVSAPSGDDPGQVMGTDIILPDIPQ